MQPVRRRPWTCRRLTEVGESAKEPVKACILDAPVTSSAKMIKAGMEARFGGLGTREDNRDISHQSGFHLGRTHRCGLVPSIRSRFKCTTLVAELIGVSDHRLAAIQRADLAHLFLGQLEVEDVDVLGHPAWI